MVVLGFVKLVSLPVFGRFLSDDYTLSLPAQPGYVSIAASTSPTQYNPGLN